MSFQKREFLIFFQFFPVSDDTTDTIRQEASQKTVAVHLRLKGKISSATRPAHSWLSCPQHQKAFRGTGHLPPGWCGHRLIWLSPTVWHTHQSGECLDKTMHHFCITLDPFCIKQVYLELVCVFILFLCLGKLQCCVEFIGFRMFGLWLYKCFFFFFFFAMLYCKLLYLFLQMEHLKACAEIATQRTINWQKFCMKDDCKLFVITYLFFKQQMFYTSTNYLCLCVFAFLFCHTAVLYFLLQVSFLVDEGVSPVLLQLLSCALCGSKVLASSSSTSSSFSGGGSGSAGQTGASQSSQSKSSSKKSKKEDKEKEKDGEKIKND